MVDKPGVFDGDDGLWLAVGIGLVLVLVLSNVAVGAQLRAFQRQGTAYLDGGVDGLQFSRNQVELINGVSEASIGDTASADERLFCFSVQDGVVTQLRFVDNVVESSFVSVAGGCNQRFGQIDGFAHTQPGFSFVLSDEDRDLESAVDYTCIIADTVVRGPMGDAGGIKCWEVVEDGFDEVEVSIE